MVNRVKHIRFPSYSIDDIRKAVPQCECWADLCIELKVSKCTFNYTRLRKLCVENVIDVSHFSIRTTSARNKFRWTAETLFVENCTIHRNGLRKLVIRLGFYTGKCEECGIVDSWNGKPLTIELDHRNGDSTDNRKTNLRWLCPNCHSQTDTYRRKIK